MSFINMPLLIGSMNGCNFQAVGTTLFISHIHWVLTFKLASSLFILNFMSVYIA